MTIVVLGAAVVDLLGLWLLAQVEPGAPAAAAPAGAIVRSVTFEGRGFIPEERLFEVAALRPGAIWTAESAAEVIRRLAAWPYLARVSPPRVASRPDGSVDVVIPIRESPITGSITFAGNDVFRSSDLLAETGLQKGTPLAEGAIAAAEAAILEKYHGDGFLLATVETETRPGPGGRVDIHFRITERRRVYVTEVRIEGAREVSPREALSGLELQPRRLFGIISRGYYVPGKLPQDLDRLRAFYRSRGYLAVEVGFGGIEMNERRSRARVILLVDEGPRHVIDRVRIEGQKLFPLKRLEQVAAIAAGVFYSEEEVLEGRRRLIRWYEGHADIAPRIELLHEFHSAGRVTVVYRILEEEHYFIGPVRVTGNATTRDRVVRRDVTLIPGGHLTGMEIERTLDRLEKSGIFSSVEVREQPGQAPNVRDVEVHVTETEKPGLFQLGGGASSGSGGVFYASLHHTNFDLFRLPRSWDDWRGAFTGGGQQLHIEVIPGSRESEYSVRFVEPYLFRSDLALTLGGGPRFYDRRTYDESRMVGQAAIQKFFDDDHHLSAVIGYVGEEVRIHELEPDAPADAFKARGHTLLAYPRLELRWSDLDINYYSGPAGLHVSTRLDIAGRATGSDVDFARPALSADYYLGLFDRRPDYRHVLHLGLGAGWINDLGGEGVPIFERFFLGGPRSFPGFQYRRLGPHEGRTPLGGEAMIHGSVDYSLPLFWRELRAFGTFQWGEVAPDVSDFSTGRFRTAAGGGLMIRLKILGQPFPATLYWVKALSTEKGDEEELFSFTVGLGF